MRLDDLARSIGGRLVGDPAVEVSRVAAPGDAGPGDLVVLADPRRLGEVEARATAVILAADAPPTRLPAIRVASVRLALARALRLLAPPRSPAPGIHATSVVAERARLGADVYLGPYVVVGAGAELGDRVQVHAHSVIEDGVRIGPDSVLHPHVTVRWGCVLGARVILQSGAVIGSDGFGYAQDEARHHIPIPQVGIVVLDDDVEDGAIAAACFIAGSVRIGHRVLMGGMSGVADHLTIGDDAVVLGDTAVTRDVPAGAIVAGRPARPRMEQRRSAAAALRLPEVLRQLQDLRRRVARLERGS